MTVIDHRRRMFADVYFREGRVYCELRGEEDCEHVRYTLNLSKVQKLLKEKAGQSVKKRKIKREETEDVRC